MAASGRSGPRRCCGVTASSSCALDSSLTSDAAERQRPERSSNSESDSSSDSAPRFSRRCASDSVPGIGSIAGDRFNSQASITCRGVAWCRFADLAQRAARIGAQRIVRHEDDPLARAVVDDVVVLPLGEVVLVLHRRDRHHFPRALDERNVDFRDADPLDRTAVNVLLDRAQTLLDRRLRVDAMEIVERDAADSQAGETLFDFLSEDLGLAAAGVAVAAFGRDDHARRRGRQRSSDGFLAFAAGVEMRRIDHLDAGVGGGADERDALVCIAEPVRAETYPTDLGVAEAEVSV